MSESTHKEETVLCPVGRFFLGLQKGFNKKSAFRKHITQSRVEFLKAIKSLVEEKIEALEKKDTAGGEEKVTKIKVE